LNLIQRALGVDKMVAKALSGLVSQQVMRVGFNQAVYVSNDTYQLFEKAYVENITFFSVIDRIAEKFGHLPRRTYKPKAEKRLKGFNLKHFEDSIAEGELSNLLMNPNSFEGQDAFFYKIALSYKGCGEAFIWKNRGGTVGGKPLELYVIPPWCMHPVGDGSLFGIASYKLDVDGQFIDLPKEDVIHWKKPSLSLSNTGEHLRGFSPLIPQKRTIEESNSAQDSTVAMMQNGGARAIVYNESLNDLTPEQMDQYTGVVNRKINTNDRKGAVATVQGKWGMLDLSKGAVDLQLMEAHEKVIKAICNANGLPYELFQSDTTFANKEQAWGFFITNTLMPMAASFDGELNRSLKPDFKSNETIATDFSELPEMQAMRLKAVDAAVAAWWLTPNERRMMMMDEPLKMAEMDKIYIPTGFVPIEDAAIDMSETGSGKDYDEDDETYGKGYG
jgi:HK97 family phage portal protein